MSCAARSVFTTTIRPTCSVVLQWMKLSIISKKVRMRQEAT